MMSAGNAGELRRTQRPRRASLRVETLTPSTIDIFAYCDGIMGRDGKFKYRGATVTNINDTRKEIKRRINKGNACYYSVEKLLSSSLFSKNLKVRIYKTIEYRYILMF
ncbi:hypothetical protein ANN_27455 [Periplaneta americana]|uniref:Uncharacterized protein n=1 Tax=Periplaneta americana TaxID=6978 RepID=A0ABQ8RVT8_PERAM|nr:hypothetical protein ANN_27455 [Periplaneta americana]